MIYQISINSMVRLSDLVPEHPDLKDHQDALKKLMSFIAGLDDRSENYSIVLKVIKTPPAKEHFKINQKLEQLIQKLSKREQQVFQLAMLGLDSNEISENLSISIETVKTHRKKIVSKAGVKRLEEIRHWIMRENF